MGEHRERDVDAEGKTQLQIRKQGLDLQTSYVIAMDGEHFSSIPTAGVLPLQGFSD